MNLPEFVAHLPDAKQNGTGYSAFCPAHDDKKTRSLSVNEGDAGDRILLKCFGDCTAEAIVAAMGLTMSDLYYDSRARSNGKLGTMPAVQPKPVKTTPQLPPIESALIEQLHRALTRAQRDLLIKRRCLSDEVIDRYQLGFTDKFHDRRVAIPILDGDGVYRDIRCWLPEMYRNDSEAAKIFHWEKGRGGARLFPVDQLRYDELLLVAGELDALAAIARGFHAVTATCGETTWPDKLSESFAGKRVQILLDNDDAGRKGTEIRAQSLARQQAKVEVVTW